MAENYELTMESLTEMLKRAYEGEHPDTLIGEYFWQQAVDDDDEDGFGCCAGGVCDCE
jgi:hypothetical protein